MAKKKTTKRNTRRTVTKKKAKKPTVAEQIQELLLNYNTTKLYNMYVVEENEARRAILREAWRISYRKDRGEEV